MTLHHPDLQPCIVRHLFAVPQLSTATEADAMNESDTFSSYTVVVPINDYTSLPDLSSLLSILKRLRGCEGADGQMGGWAALAGERCVTWTPREPGEERARDGGSADGAEAAACGRPLPGGSGAGAALG